MNNGDKVIWKHSPGRGYGYTFDVPATVVQVHSKRVKIEVALRSGGTVLRLVKPERLRAA